MSNNSKSSSRSILTQEDYESLIEDIVENHTYVVEEDPRSVANILVVDVLEIDGELVVLKSADPYHESRLWPMEIIEYAGLPSMTPINNDSKIITGRKVAVDTLTEDLEIQHDEYITNKC